MATHCSPLFPPFSWPFKHCDLWEEAWSIFPLQLMWPRACSVLNYSSPFEVLSIPTNRVDWNQIDCFDWQDSRKIGDEWEVECWLFTSETLWLKPCSSEVLSLQMPSPASLKLWVQWNAGEFQFLGFDSCWNPAAVLGDPYLIWRLKNNNVLVLSSLMEVSTHFSRCLTWASGKQASCFF